jgi:hypothetical protein
MALDLTRNARTQAQPCVPCCHVTKSIYHGVVAVIAPSYPSQIDFPFLHTAYNYTTYLPTYRTFNYTSSSFALGLDTTVGNVRTYKSGAMSLDVATNNTTYPNYPTIVSTPYYVKLIVVENVSIDVFFSTDGITYVKQDETFYGEYFSFVTDIIDLAASVNPITVRVTINAGINSTPAYSSANPSQYNYHANFTDAGDYTGSYRNNVPVGEDYLPVGGQNVITTNSIKCGDGAYAPYINSPTDKRVCKPQQATDGSGYFTFLDIISGRQFDGGYIIYPVYNWFPLPASPSSPYYNNIWGYEDASYPSVSTQVTALVDYRLPVHYVARPYFFSSTVLFVKLYWPHIFPQVYDSTFNKPLSISQVTITE